MNQLAFLHIPKTGGRTMIELCRYFYRPDQCGTIIGKTSEDTIKGYQFIHSHFAYDILPPTKARLVFTILREPGRRIASYYQMCLKSRPEDWSLYSLFWRGNKPMPILDFAMNKINMTAQVDNAMVRQLHSYALLTSLNKVNEGHVEVAIRNLSNLMVGFQDNYDAFVDRLCAEMGWQKPDYPSNNRSMPYTISESILEEIRAINRYDVMLYEWAKDNLRD